MHLATHRTLIACAFADDASATAAVTALGDLGVADASLRIGAVDAARGQALAAALGAAADIDVRDPLAGVVGLAYDTEASGRTDHGALVGAAIGSVAGVALGVTPVAGLISSPAHLEVLADVLVFGVIGCACGAVLGTALGPQRSTHAGFRLVDAAEAGDIIVLVTVTADEAAGARAAFERAGARDLALFEGQP